MYRTSKNVYLGPIRAVKTDTHFHRIEPAEIALFPKGTKQRITMEN